MLTFGQCDLGDAFRDLLENYVCISAFLAFRRVVDATYLRAATTSLVFNGVRVDAQYLLIL